MRGKRRKIFRAKACWVQTAEEKALISLTTVPHVSLQSPVCMRELVTFSIISAVHVRAMQYQEICLTLTKKS